MAALSLSIDALRPMNRWNHDRIQPGNVGSVGDVNLQPRLKHSAPDLPLRYQPDFAHKNEVFLGSNVQNGSSASYVSGGGPASVVDSNWGGRRDFKISHGWIYQDMRAPDTLHEPLLGETPHYSWNNKIATTYEAFRTGNQFLPVPGAYMLHPGEVPRGGQVPRIVDNEAQEDDIALTNVNTGKLGVGGGQSVVMSSNDAYQYPR